MKPGLKTDLAKTSLEGKGSITYSGQLKIILILQKPGLAANLAVHFGSLDVEAEVGELQMQTAISPAPH